MTDGPYRAHAHRCASCDVAPMRELGNRLICDACGAVQVDPADLADEIGLREVTFADGDRLERACPRCAERLLTCQITVGETRLPHVVARCRAHGLWLDSGLLDTILVDGIRAAREVGHRDPTVPDVHGAATGAAGPRRGMPYVVQKWWEKRPRRPAEPFRSAFTGRTLACPRCSEHTLEVDGHRWACARCGGAFVETAALEDMVAAMVQRPWRLPPSSGQAGGLGCPVCGARMLAGDRCTQHGVWFDAGGLERLLQDVVAPSSSWLRRLFRRGRG